MRTKVNLKFSLCLSFWLNGVHLQIEEAFIFTMPLLDATLFYITVSLFLFRYNIVSKFSGKGSHVSRRYHRALISKYLINVLIKCTKRAHITVGWVNLHFTGTSIDIHVKPTPGKWFVWNMLQKITRNCIFLLHYQSVNQI